MFILNIGESYFCVENKGLNDFFLSLYLSWKFKNNKSLLQKQWNYSLKRKKWQVAKLLFIKNKQLDKG